MEFNQNRLRFVHCEHLFNNIDEIKNYVRSVQYERASLYAEPMIFKYGDKKNPCIVLAIGSVGEGKFVYDTETGDVLNETFYIDFSQVEKDIEDIRKEFGENGSITKLVENIISSCGLDENGNYVTDFKDKIIGEATSLFIADKMLSEYVIALEKKHELYVKDTNTVVLTSEKSESGVTLLADVKLGSKIYDGRVIENIIEKRKKSAEFLNEKIENLKQLNEPEGGRELHEYLRDVELLRMEYFRKEAEIESLLNSNGQNANNSSFWSDLNEMKSGRLMKLSFCGMFPLLLTILISAVIVAAAIISAMKI